MTYDTPYQNYRTNMYTNHDNEIYLDSRIRITRSSSRMQRISDSVTHIPSQKEIFFSHRLEPIMNPKRRSPVDLSTVPVRGTC